MSRTAGFVFLLLFGVIASGRAQNLDSLLGHMTLEEKLGQLNLPSSDTRATPAVLEQIRRGRVGGLLNVFGVDAVREAQRTAVEQSRLRIPLLFGLDVIHGYRTIFPIPLAEAGTFDPGLIESAARMAGREARANGVNWTFAPMVDIARDPRWGRIAEGSGEDPYLGSVMAAARVRGFQQNILATAKHFAAYGGAEAGRDYNVVDISDRTLRDVYLPPFKAAVDAGVGSLMSAFNEIGGVPASGSAWLTDTLLRGEWRFNGFVVSDWTSVAELVPHGVAASRTEAGRIALTAGVDMDMVSAIYVDSLAALVRTNRIPTAVVDSAVLRILRVKKRFGLFTDPYRFIPAPNQQEARALARQVAQQSIVLLKNDANVLPLTNAKTIAVIGPLADNKLDALGPWHTQGRAEDVVTLVAALRGRPGVQVVYAQGAGIEDSATAGIADAVAAARRADVAILVLGERHDMSGEAASRSELGLPGVQQQLLEAVVATGKPVVLILMNGRPLIVEWAAEHVPAIVEAWFLGVETGPALADVLFGAVNPSGRLPITFPRNVGQIPIYYNHRNTGRPVSATDKYTSKYIDVPVTPRYPFGFGLSYTTFTYADLNVATPRLRQRDTLRVSVDVRNTGSRPGATVVQLYVRDDVGTVTRPLRELKAFQRVQLAAGESRRIELRVPVQQLAFWGPSGGFVVEAGSFHVYVGQHSAEGIEGTFQVID
jgi:beta-glucosidase